MGRGSAGHVRERAAPGPPTQPQRPRAGRGNPQRCGQNRRAGRSAQRFFAQRFSARQNFMWRCPFERRPGPCGIFLGLCGGFGCGEMSLRCLVGALWCLCRPFRALMSRERCAQALWPLCHRQTPPSFDHFGPLCVNIWPKLTQCGQIWEESGDRRMNIYSNLAPRILFRSVWVYLRSVCLAISVEESVLVEEFVSTSPPPPPPTLV